MKETETAMGTTPAAALEPAVAAGHHPLMVNDPQPMYRLQRAVERLPFACSYRHKIVKNITSRSQFFLRMFEFLWGLAFFGLLHKLSGAAHPQKKLYRGENSRNKIA